MSALALVRNLGFAALASSFAVAQIPGHAAAVSLTSGLGDLRMARTGDVVHVVGLTALPNSGVVNYARSTDGGRTFPVHDVPLAYLGNFFLSAGLMGAFVADGDHVYLSVNLPWVGPHLISSHDGGTTWSHATPISRQTSVPFATRPAVYANGLDVTVMWTENRTTGSEWCNRSNDGGATWLAQDVALDTGAVGTDGDLRLVTFGTELHAFWNRTSSPAHAAHQRSQDGGATWLGSPQFLPATRLVAAAGSDQVLVTVAEAMNAMHRSVDGGSTWLPVAPPGIASIYDIAVGGATVLVVGRQATTNAALLQVSVDAGATWLPAPYQVGVFRGALVTAHVSRDALWVHFKFVDANYPLGVVIQSDDRGISWRQAAGDAGRSMAASEGGAIVLTTYASNSDWVYAWVLEGHTRLGQGTVGTGGIAPRLSGRGLAGLGRDIDLEVDRARGGSLGVVFGSLGASLPTAIGGGTFWLPQPVPMANFVSTGSPGAAGVGTAATRFRLPTSTAFSGMRLLTQAALVDPAAAAGFVLTGAVESWMF